MTNPITPPPELVEKWWGDKPSGTSIARLATQSAQWGADQELEACCEWLDTEKILTKDGGYIRKLRDARRPKPPSLKEQALEALQFVDEKLDLPLHNHCNAIHTIRRALEALDD
jgi:hypothetical protein